MDEDEVLVNAYPYRPVRFASNMAVFLFRKYSGCSSIIQAFKIHRKSLLKGYTQTSLIGTLIFPAGPSFPLPFV